MVRTRFAPSPTGALHLGGARTALFNYLYARHHNGTFLLRIEDTDRERSTEANVAQITDALNWLGIAYDGKPVRQAARAARHAESIAALIKAGHAYYCDCTPERLAAVRAEQEAQKIKPRYDRHCRGRNLGPGLNTVVRFRTPIDGEVVVADSLKGQVVFNNAELDDLVIARADGSATYHLAVVVDDIDAGITHILRGDDHLNNTPRQMHIIAALGAAMPQYTHLPMILDAQGKKLSKRSGAADVLSWREEGYLPDAMLNILARLGWSHGDDELFAHTDLVRLFDLAALNAAPARLDPKKSLWVNQQQLKTVAHKTLEAECAWHAERLAVPLSTLPAKTRTALLSVQRQRCRTVAEIVEQSRWLIGEGVAMDAKAREKHVTAEALARIAAFVPKLEAIAKWNAEKLNAALDAHLEEGGLKPAQLAQPLRVVLTGGTVSPSIGDTLALLGKAESLHRIAAACEAV